MKKQKKIQTEYPIIDLFAGPGGLGEGFSNLYRSGSAKRVFKSIISIERDEFAHQTLQLRHFFRSFPKGKVPADYYDYLEARISKNELIERNEKVWKDVEKTALRISLGKQNHDKVQKLIQKRLGKTKKWVLIGGPPCQAYSLVGRSRMMGNPEFENDERHFLYKEYLKIIIDHRPPVFLMENVKGLLSAKVNGKSVISKIFEDLRSPVSAIKKDQNGLKYNLYSLTESSDKIEKLEPKSFIVKAEEYGVPQARHRMLILGIRSDIEVIPRVLKKKESPIVEQVIGDLPAIRSKLSRGKDSISEWKKALVSLRENNWKFTDFNKKDLISEKLLTAIELICRNDFENTSKKVTTPAVMNKWYRDKQLNVMTLHTARSHMVSDLQRYLFSALFAVAFGKSPKLADFPKELLPNHKNVKEGCDGKKFSDRFRVQVKSRVSTTITSHISKDGHYFIHYDPVQCRSLTVREAARLQTFPDNYYFEGPRTAKYHQVGNAVPPYLANQIAEIVRDVLDQITEED